MKVEHLADEDLNRMVAEKVMLEKEPSLDLLKDKDIFNIIWNNDYEDFLFSPKRNWYATVSGYTNGDKEIWVPASFTQRWDEAIRALTTCPIDSEASICLEAKFYSICDGNFITLFKDLSPRKICEMLVSVI